MRPIPPLLSLLLRASAMVTLGGTLARAQSTPDVVRGRVTDDSARAVVGATVMITRGPDRLTQQATTTGHHRQSVIP